MSEFGALVEW